MTRTVGASHKVVRSASHRQLASFRCPCHASSWSSAVHEPSPAVMGGAADVGLGSVIGVGPLAADQSSRLTLDDEKPLTARHNDTRCLRCATGYASSVTQL